MLFNITSMWQIIGLLMVFTALVLLNEFERRKTGAIVMFGVVLAVLTIYFIYVNVAGVECQTTLYMGGWFHYAKLYASVAGCIGFCLIKYKKGIGATHWFKAFPFVIVAINILIAVASDFESAIKGAASVAQGLNGWWFSNEGVWLNGGWWNWVNGIAGILNILCMTAWWSVYSSNDEKKLDMIWPDMTIWFIVAYDLWNFQYTYANLPTHTWYCGVALLLAPTFANALWNKGGWIQNRANTLATWCMFAQVFPLFQISGTFGTALPVVYNNVVAETGASNGLELGNLTADVIGKIAPNYSMQGFVAMAALFANIICLAVIIKRSIEMKKNPYKEDIWVGTKDYEEAFKKAEI